MNIRLTTYQAMQTAIAVNLLAGDATERVRMAFEVDLDNGIISTSCPHTLRVILDRRIHSLQDRTPITPDEALSWSRSARSLKLADAKIEQAIKAKEAA